MIKWLRTLWRAETEPPAATAPERVEPGYRTTAVRNPAPAADGTEAHITVRTQTQAGTHVTFIRLEGVLSSETAAEFEQRLEEFIAGGQVHLVVDFSGVPYVSSRGWGILISTVQAFRRQGGDIQVMGMSPNVQKLFFQTGLSAIFEIYSGRGPQFYSEEDLV